MNEIKYAPENIPNYHGLKIRNYKSSWFSLDVTIFLQNEEISV